jgi:4-alpha-glucanotransferase
MNKRRSGLLLHLTSLPSRYGIGDLGPGAYRFVDFLAEAKQGIWQILPLNPTDPAYGNSPYHSISAFASNELLISPDLMAEEGWLTKNELKSPPDFPPERVDYNRVISYKKGLFRRAFERFRPGWEYEEFSAENSSWLEDLALFATLKEAYGGEAWSDWEPAVRNREPQALNSLKEKHRDAIERRKFLQFVLFRQWRSLKSECNRRMIHIFGDMPIYVDYDSADVWTHSELFNLDADKKPLSVAGVPPDYFSATGQRWGNPIYRWDVLRERGFDWWIYRFEHCLKLLDLVRVDHFRGFVGYWEVPAAEPTAVNGRWVEAPAYDFFNRLTKRFPCLPIVAEDLGIITPEVREIMRHFGFPGMKVLLFAFGEDNPGHPYLPHNYEENCVVYTGTHDNNTARGWFDREARPEDKTRLFRYLGREVSSDEIHRELIRLGMRSVASTSVFPVQDVLGLGGGARMNLPATAHGNWEWRLLPDQLTANLAGEIGLLTEIYGRS